MKHASFSDQKKEILDDLHDIDKLELTITPMELQSTTSLR